MLHTLIEKQQPIKQIQQKQIKHPQKYRRISIIAVLYLCRTDA